MDILLQGVTIIDPAFPFHNQLQNIFIQNGFISEIGSASNNADEIVAFDGLHVSVGWVDGFAHFYDPGLEFRETVESGAAAAAAGGFTDVLLAPDSSPVSDTKAIIEYIVSKATHQIASVHPVGAVTKSCAGTELAEMYDMHRSGAVAFGDGLHSIQAGGVLLKALQYLKAIDKTLIQIPLDVSLAANGLMNEGITSTQLGMSGSPAIAEHIAVSKAIALANYTGAKIHLTGISSAASIELIKTAKQNAVNVTCSVSPHHLFFTESDLTEYDTNLKVSPPLRTTADRQALIEALVDGTVDCIATHHNPQHLDAKQVEFEYAKEGMIGLETAYGAVTTAAPMMPLQKMIEVFSFNARKIFGLTQSTIKPGQPACLTLFNPDEEWRAEKFASKSFNSPFFGKTLTGRPIGIINKDRLHLNR